MVLLVDRNNEATELYDLSTDISQEMDLISEKKYKKLIERLRATFVKHNDHDDTTFDEPRTTTAFSKS